MALLNQRLEENKLLSDGAAIHRGEKTAELVYVPFLMIIVSNFIADTLLYLENGCNWRF